MFKDITKEGKIFDKFKRKKRFLNWDPARLMEGEDFKPKEIIKSTRSIQDALQTKEQLTTTIRNLPKYMGGVGHNSMRTKEECDEEYAKYERERFFKKFDRSLQLS